jgi:ribosomal protein S18 acetylase RimI-like enzyme
MHGAKARIDEEAAVPNPIPAVRYVGVDERDADAIALLHAESWRRHYRGAYSDTYLDGEVVAERREVWRGRLAEATPGQFTIVARRDDQIVGFAHTILDENQRWGSLLENLHVRSELTRSGIGTHLLSQTALTLLRARPGASLHLWVLDQNTAAQAFYGARGGRRVETELRGPFPGGGHAMGHRYHWADPTRLLVDTGSAGDGGHN